MIMYIHLSIIITVLFYRKTTKNHKYALALVFAMDEINRNPDLLPNMSLIIKYTLGHCDGKTVTPTPYSFHKKKHKALSLIISVMKRVYVHVCLQDPIGRYL